MPDRSNRPAEPRISLVAPENAQRFLERYGSIADAAARQVAVAAVQRLLTDQKRLRTRIHTLEDSPHSGGGLSAADRDELEELRRDNEDLTARVPKTGEVVLSAEDAAKWARIQKLNKPVEEIEKAITDLPKLLAEKETNTQASNARKAAKLLGKNQTAFEEIARDKGYTFEFKTETVDGKAVEVPYIRERDAAKDAAPVKLSELIGELRDSVRLAE